MNEKQETINALNNLKESFKLLNEVWDNSDKIILNDTESISQYPFEKSFDEVYLDVCNWVDETTEELGKSYIGE